MARLKGGDPFIFGRGGEEIDALVAAGIPVVVVPGITAALGAAASAGLPLTQRGLAQSVTFVTAQGEGAELLDWRALAAPGQTVVFYMGISQLPRIVGHLLAHGAPASRPVAIVERATLPEQRVLAATLRDIVGRAQQPAQRRPRCCWWARWRAALPPQLWRSPPGGQETHECSAGFCRGHRPNTVDPAASCQRGDRLRDLR